MFLSYYKEVEKNLRLNKKILKIDGRVKKFKFYSSFFC